MSCCGGGGGGGGVLAKGLAPPPSVKERPLVEHDGVEAAFET